ncbi:hypothetical protein EMCRGX_G029165 [Ephydatia muelleri]
MEQREYDMLLAFCCDCKYPPECSKNEKDCIRRKAKNFIVKEGLLFYRDKDNKEYRVVTESEKHKVLEGCHSAELGGGHFGRDKTLVKISERFYWLGMVNDVKEYCKTCEKCQKANRKFDKFSAELHPIPVKDEVWHTIGVDLIGPLPITQKGNKYIMTVSCLFSKWPEATALPDKTATGVTEFLFLCFTRHGCCKVKITDQGREFVNQTMVDVRKKALENIEKAQGRQKVYYDQIHCKDRELYEVGTLVLLKNSKKLTKKGSKMEPNWTGPYLIHEVLSKGTYRLSHPNPPFKVLAQKYNMTRLKIFYQRDQLQDSESESKSEAVDKEDSPIPPGNLSKDDPCKCQKRCATKRCPCKRKNQPCSSWCHAGRSCCNTSAITNCTTHLVITVSDEQPSVPNKKLLDVAVLDDPDGWLDDEHISAGSATTTAP